MLRSEDKTLQTDRKKVLIFVTNTLVHNCSIFLWSQDVGNMGQGGDLLCASVNHKMGCGGHSWPKWVAFFLKKQLLRWKGREITLFRTPKFHFLVPGGYFFPTFRSFQNLPSLFKIYLVHNRSLEESSSVNSENRRGSTFKAGYKQTFFVTNGGSQLTF